ncbi:MAG: hypothetical protein KGL39_43855 [Patescibacteria group bacterium]|nr:hypothetical protein [Patescibacteria group bacterium]
MRGIDAHGRYFAWGERGKRYYYTTPVGAKRAHDRAARQGRAIQWRRHGL